MSTQPYSSPGVRSSDSRHDPDLKPVPGDAADQLSNSPSPSTEAQKDARQQDADDPRTRAEGHAQRSPGEVSDPGGDEAPRERDEEEAELDDALDDSFPASDPVSPASTPKKR